MNISKSKLIKLFAALVFIALVNVGLFSLASIKMTSFWISWAFIHIAFLVFVCIMIFSVAEQKQLMSAYSESAVATYYLIVEVIAGFVLMFNFAYLPVVAFVIQAIILGIFAIAFFALKNMNKNNANAERVKKDYVQHYNYIVEAMNDAKNQMDYSAPYKKTVEHAYDAIINSQVRSSNAVYEIELKIIDLIRELKDGIVANDEASIKVTCKSIENEIAERNRKLRAEQ
jgi:hypothetical protein